jgi:hypothetical protein
MAFDVLAVVGSVAKGQTSEIRVAVVSVDGNVRVDLREHVSLDRYSGPTKKGVILSAEDFAALVALAPAVQAEIAAAPKGNGKKAKR